jgi:hypothetical protein
MTIEVSIIWTLLRYGELPIYDKIPDSSFWVVSNNGIEVESVKKSQRITFPILCVEGGPQNFLNLVKVLYQVVLQQGAKGSGKFVGIIQNIERSNNGTQAYLGLGYTEETNFLKSFEGDSNRLSSLAKELPTSLIWDNL